MLPALEYCREVIPLDVGHWSQDNTSASADQGIAEYFAAGLLDTGSHCRHSSDRYSRTPPENALWTAGSEGKSSIIYAESKAILELMNDQIKEGRFLFRILLIVWGRWPARTS